MSALKATIKKYQLRRESTFSLSMPVLRRALKIEAINNIPYAWILIQEGQLVSHEEVYFLMLCEGQRIHVDITELDYWGSLNFLEEDHTFTVCHYFSTRKDVHLHGSGQRDQRIRTEHGLRVA